MEIGDSNSLTATFFISMITIYGLSSPYVARVRAALLQKQLPFQHVQVSISAKSEEFRKLTLVETIPILEDDDGTIVGDSLHIVDYLDQKYPASYPLLGRELSERIKILGVIAAVDKIISLFTPLHTEYEQKAPRLEQQGLSHRAMLYTAEQKKDMQREVIYRLSKIQQAYEGEGKIFVTGRFSAADAALLSLVRNLAWKIPGEDLSFWEQWLKTLLADPTIAAMFPGPEEKVVRSI